MSVGVSVGCVCGGVSVGVSVGCGVHIVYAYVYPRPSLPCLSMISDLPL